MPSRKYIYSDIDSKLKKSAGGDLEVEYDEQSVLQAVKNILSTIKGERIRNGLGSNLLAYLFEPMQPDTVDDIRTEVFNNLREYEPRINKLDVRVVPKYDKHIYEIYMRFTVNRFTRPLSFQINLNAMNEN